MKILFEKLASDYILSCFGYYVNNGQVFKRGTRDHANCVYCGKEMTLDNLAGVRPDGLVCSSLSCIIEISDELKSKKEK